jgi:hypothetical protein
MFIIKKFLQENLEKYSDEDNLELLKYLNIDFEKCEPEVLAMLVYKPAEQDLPETFKYLVETNKHLLMKDRIIGGYEETFQDLYDGLCIIGSTRISDFIRQDTTIFNSTLD